MADIFDNRLKKARETKTSWQRTVENGLQEMGYIWGGTKKGHIMKKIGITSVGTNTNVRVKQNSEVTGVNLCFLCIFL